MNEEQDKLNDHMLHILGRVSHLEVQVESLARSAWKLQESVDRAEAAFKTDEKIRQSFAAGILRLGNECRDLAGVNAVLKAEVERLRGGTFADGSQLIDSPQGFTIIDEPAPYNRENKGDLGQK
jgi:hypothetical protein